MATTTLALAQLTDLFPDRQSDDLLIAFQQCGNSIDDTIDFLLSNTLVPEDQSPSFPNPRHDEIYERDIEFARQLAMEEEQLAQQNDPQIQQVIKRENKENMREIERNEVFEKIMKDIEQDIRERVLNDNSIGKWRKDEWLNGFGTKMDTKMLSEFYDQLQNEYISCPICRSNIRRRSFLLRNSDFQTTIDHVKSSLAATCPCTPDKYFCACCGGSYDSYTNEEVLYHCPDIQSLILSLGMCFLERENRFYIELETEEHSNNTRPKSHKSTAGCSNAGVGYGGSSKDTWFGDSQNMKKKKKKSNNTDQQQDGKVGASDVSSVHEGKDLSDSDIDTDIDTWDSSQEMDPEENYISEDEDADSMDDDYDDWEDYSDYGSANNSRRRNMAGKTPPLPTRRDVIEPFFHRRILTILRLLRPYLPHPTTRLYTSDFLPHPTLPTILRRTLLPILSKLLHGDPMVDMDPFKIEFYEEVFGWMQLLAEHESLVGLLVEDVMIAEKVTNENANVKIGKRKRNEKEMIDVDALDVVTPAPLVPVEYSPSASLSTLIETSVTQAITFTKFATNGVREDPAVCLLGFATMITDVHRNIRQAIEGAKALVKSGGMNTNNEKRMDMELDTDNSNESSLWRSSRNKEKSQATEKRSLVDDGETSHSLATSSKVDDRGIPRDLIKTYEAWARTVCFEYISLSNPLVAAESTKVTSKPGFHKNHTHVKGRLDSKYVHYFDQEIQSLQSVQTNRTILIAKELATLSTGLPTSWESSVFLRVDEERMDCLKMVLVGPEATPYENGCFEFDIFLPADYPQVPPMVQFLTTGNGTWRANPNLYNNGKVCLSLLGTWSGPGWIPNKSTLLQVIISLQSMVFVPDPYCNEPGFEQQGDSENSKVYNKDIRRDVVKNAMIGMLQNPPYGFEDIIKKHFRLKRDYIIDVQLPHWKATNKLKISNMGSVNHFNGFIGQNVTQTQEIEDMEESLKGLLEQLDRDE